MKPTFIILSLLTGLLHAQEQPPKEAAKQGPPMRLIALGEPPPFRQELRGDRRVEVAPEKGSLPPGQITVAGNPAMPFRLGQAAPLAHVPPLASLELQDQSSTWSTLTVPEALRAKPKLALFWRDPGKSWSNPRCMLLDDGADVFPAGQVRFVNLLPTNSAIKIGTQTHELTPGQTWLCPAPVTAQTLQIAFRAADGAWQSVHNATFEPAAAGLRMEVIIYRADSPAARQPAKALVLRTPVTPITEQPTTVASAAP